MEPLRGRGGTWWKKGRKEKGSDTKKERKGRRGRRREEKKGVGKGTLLCVWGLTQCCAGYVYLDLNTDCVVFLFSVRLPYV